MLALLCGDVVAGCDREFRGLDHGNVVALASDHAERDHGQSAMDYQDRALGFVRAM